jgi:hypothetical protein
MHFRSMMSILGLALVSFPGIVDASCGRLKARRRNRL